MTPSRDRNPKGGDAVERLRAKHESATKLQNPAVTRKEAQALLDPPGTAETPIGRMAQTIIAQDDERERLIEALAEIEHSESVEIARSIARATLKETSR